MTFIPYFYVAIVTILPSDNILKSTTTLYDAKYFVVVFIVGLLKHEIKHHLQGTIYCLFV